MKKLIGKFAFARVVTASFNIDYAKPEDYVINWIGEMTHTLTLQFPNYLIPELTIFN